MSNMRVFVHWCTVSGGSGPEARTFLDYCVIIYRIRLNGNIQMLLIF